MKILTLKDFMNEYNSKNDTMKTPQLRKIYDSLIYRRDSKIHSDKGFINIDNGSQDGTHRTCFIVKNDKSF